MHFHMELILLIFALRQIYAVEVVTSSGPVQGKYRALGNKQLLVFKNVPYARPPVKDLRFEKPLDAIPWTTAPEYNRISSCVQFGSLSGRFSQNDEIGAEDCLLLDIYTPNIPQENVNVRLLPVLVYFHGGRFMTGNKDDYEPVNLIKDQDIIVVIPNYRLGILGFFSTNDKELPGNLGLFDQRKALEWVSKDIALFGGDPSRVTISGHGAGGASAGLHILSRSSQALFSAAISGSGTALNAWVVQPWQYSDNKHLADYLECSLDSRSLVQCLRQKPISTFVSFQRNHQNITFGPIVDANYTAESFLPDHPMKLYGTRNFAKIPYLAGVTTDEASMEFYNHYAEAVTGMHLDKMLATYMNPYLRIMPNTDVVIKATNYHYLRGRTANSFLDFAPQFIQLLTDFLYNSGLQETLKFHSEAVEDVWMYVFNFKGDKSLGNAIGPSQYRDKFGVSHMEDIIYLFNTTYVPMLAGDRSQKMRTMDEELSRIWRAFIITRQPPPGRKWLKFSPSNKSYLEIGDGITLKTNYRQGDLDFWTILIPELVEASISTIEKVSTNSPDRTETWAMVGVAVVLAVLCVALAAVVVVTRKKVMRNCSMSVCAAPESFSRSSKV